MEEKRETISGVLPGMVKTLGLQEVERSRLVVLTNLDVQGEESETKCGESGTWAIFYLTNFKIGN